MTTPPTKDRTLHQTRWYLRQETILIPFGVARREAVVWVAYRTAGRDRRGVALLIPASRTVFTAARGGLSAARRHAANEARRHYGSTR